MSDEPDVEKLLENFQNALDTLNDIGDLDGIIVKLDAKNNRKLLKKVKTIVSDVHIKVNTIKNKVSKAYKKVKTRTNSEIDESVANTSNDKVDSDKEADSGDQSSNLEDSSGSAERLSPVLGRKGVRKCKRSSKPLRESKNAEVVECTDKDKTEKTVSDSLTVCEDNIEHNSDENEKQDVETDQEKVDNANTENASETSDIPPSGDDLNQEIDGENDDINSSLEIIDNTPQKPSLKISLSLSLRKKQHPVDQNASVVEILDSTIETDNVLDQSSAEEEKEIPDTDDDPNEIDDKNKNSDDTNKEDNMETEDVLDAQESDDNLNKNDSSESSDKKNKSNKVSNENTDIEDSNSSSKKNNNKETEEVDESMDVEDTDSSTIRNKNKKNTSSNTKTTTNMESDDKTNMASDDLNETEDALDTDSSTKKNRSSNKNKKVNKELDDLDGCKDTEDSDSNPKKNKKKKKGTDKKKNANKEKDDIDEGEGGDDSDTDSNAKKHKRSDKKKKTNMEPDDSDESQDAEDSDSNSKTTEEIKEESNDNPPKTFPKIKLVDINKLLAPNVKPMALTPTPTKNRKSVTFDCSVIVLTSSDDDTPKKTPKDEERTPLKSALRKTTSTAIELSDSDSKENNENSKDTNKSKKIQKSPEKKLSSEHSDDSDFGNTRSKRLRDNKKAFKNRFSELVKARDNRVVRSLRRRQNDGSSDEESSKSSRKSKRNRDKKLESESDDEDRSGKDKTNSKKSSKRRRKKELLEESSLSDNSDSENSDISMRKSSRQSRSKRTKTISYPVADINDPQFKAAVYIRLPKFKCEELPKLYKEKKEIFEIKNLSKMKLTRRRQKPGSSKTSDEPTENPNQKKIKLTLKLNKRGANKKKQDSSDDEEHSSSKEDGKNEQKKKNGKDKNGDPSGKSDEDTDMRDLTSMDFANDAAGNANGVEQLAMACLEQVNENSDKEDDANGDDKDSDEGSEVSDKGKKKSKEKAKKDAEVEKKSKSKKKEKKKGKGDMDDSDEASVDDDKENSDEEAKKKGKNKGKENSKVEKNARAKKKIRKGKESDEDNEEGSDESSVKGGKNIEKDKKRKKKGQESEEDDKEEDSDKGSVDGDEKAKKKDKKKSKGSDDEDDNKVDSDEVLLVDSDDEKAKKKDKKKGKKGKGSDDEDDDNKDDSDEASADKKKDEDSKLNGKLSDSDDEDIKKAKNKRKKRNSSDSDSADNTNTKKGKSKKSDGDDSDSDSEDFAKFSKKRDKSGKIFRELKKRMQKKKKVISDSESDNDDKKDKSDNSDEDFKNDKASESGSNSSEKEDDDSDKEEKKKTARKRIKKTKDSSSDDEDDKSTRKHLRKMIDRDSLSETTKKAEQDEKERKARIIDKQKKYNQIFELKADAVVDKVVLDFDEKTDKPLLSVSKKLVKKLKPHQVHGVKFMWDACFESLERAKKTAGSGCILAHCMGLGKTLQVITLIHTLLMNQEKTKVEKILVVCPVNTVLNWKNEFKKWIPESDDLEVYELVSCKTSHVNQERNHAVQCWHEGGGVLIIGYNMFRTLSNPDNKGLSKKMRTNFQTGLVDPGPDLVVCDEGHLLKNEKTHLSIAMNRIKSLRRIVLTGTPLQNNLREYWCMVQFIKPNLLGSYKEYLNRFVNPIINGQYTDSTQHDIMVMRRRAHVLHKLLDGVVQRQDYAVLEPYLPPKYEYVLFLKPTEVQKNLYHHYIENFARKAGTSNRTSFLFTDFQELQRICTHPRVLLDKSIENKEKKDMQDDESESEGSLKDFIDDESDASSSNADGSTSDNSGSGSDASHKKKKTNSKKHKRAPKTRLTRAQAAQKRENGESSSDDDVVQVPTAPKEWWDQYIERDQLDNINHSAKIFLLFQILKECEEIGDKILVFSQSLYTLNCIEYFLSRIDEATQKGETEGVGGHTGSWALGLDYFRLDGSSSCDNRATWCDSFNDPENIRARLFLISTKAGGLGINLVAANRVIIFDVSWNPSHDIQSIYRVYRFGQTKPSYVYRFVTYGTMEMKIYERQVTKQAISKRVIDEQQIDRHYSQNDIQELYQTDLDPKDRPIPMVPKDVLLGEMVHKYDKTIYKYHEHQSLLENKQDEELNEDERKAAWDEFENEKVLRKTTVTNFGGVHLGAINNSDLNFSPQLIQMALGNIVRKDNPTWSDVQIKGILPALVTQLQVQMSENDFAMYNRVQQEIRIMQAIHAQRMRENFLKQYQLQQMLQKQQLANQLMGNMNITPEEIRAIQMAQATQNYIQPQAAAAGQQSGSAANALAAVAARQSGGAAQAAVASRSNEVIELND